MDAVSESFGKWLSIALQLAKCAQGGTNSDDIRSIIQEEMKKSQNRENNEMMRQMLAMIEQKHAAELYEASRERDIFKTQAELLTKQLQELQRSKQAEDKNKVDELLRNFVQLNMNQQPIQSTNDRKGYQRSPYTQKYPQKGKQNNNGSTLPWMDFPKSNPNTTLGVNPKQPFNHGKQFQYHKNFNYSGNKHGENLDKSFNQEKKGHYEKDFNYSDTKFGGNPDKPLNQGKKSHYYKKNIQHGNESTHDMASRGHQSKRGAGRGQRDFNNRGRGRGRSASVGPNVCEPQVGNPATLNNDTIQPTTSFHVQVTKTVGNQWLSSENLSNASHRGRGHQGGSARGGQHRGSGGARGRGRGRGNANFQSQGNQYPTGNKNRKKKINEQEGDPEDNCTLS